MDEIMKEPQISLGDRERAANAASDTNNASQKGSEHDQIYLNNAIKAIETSKRNRQDKYDFDGYSLGAAISNLQKLGLDQTKTFFDLLVEQLQCACKVIPGRAGKEPPIVVYEYAYDDLEALEASESYQYFADMKELFPREYADVDRVILEPIRSYYDALDRNAETDIVILYDDEYKQLVGQLCEELDAYLVREFNISSNTTYHDPDLLGALHHATFMIMFCHSAEAGENHFRTNQFKHLASAQEKSVLLITDTPEQSAKSIIVPFSEEDWAEQVNAKAAKLVNDGALPKEAFIRNLLKREELIRHLTESNPLSAEAHQNLCDALEKQISDIEDYDILYGDNRPCTYGVGDLEEIKRSIQVQAEYNEDNRKRWIAKIKRDDKEIRAILSNRTPARFFERYMKLCRLIDAQHEHRDSLLSYYTLEDLKQRVGNAEIERLKLHAFRWEYQQAFKNVCLEVFMRPFDKMFAACVAIDSIHPLKIDKHIENFEHLEACGIFLAKADGLTYWTKYAFQRAVSEKKYDQNLITSQLDRMIDFSRSLEHFLRDYANPTFNQEVLRKQAQDLTDLIRDFKTKWNLPLEYKKSIYKGYKGKVCFVKFTKEGVLSKAVEEAIARNNAIREQDVRRERNIDALMKERGARINSSKIFYELAESYNKQYKETHDPLMIDMANQNYMKAANLGHRVAQYMVALHAERGLGFPQDREFALAHYRMAAYNDHAHAQYKLAEHYRASEDLETAREWYEAAATNGSVEACIFLGDSYKDTEPWRAVEYYLLAAEHRPAEIAKLGEERRAVVSEDLCRKGQYEEALSWLDSSSKNVRSVLAYGDCCYMAGDYETAMEKYQAVPAEALSTEQQKRLAHYWFKKDDHGVALDYYLRCAAAGADLSVQRNIVKCYLSVDKLSEAISVYNDMASQHPDHALMRKLADALYEGRKYQQALAYYTDYTAQLADADVVEKIGNCYRGLGQVKEACAFYEQHLDAFAGSSELENIAELFLGQNMFEQAVSCYSQFFAENHGLTIPEDLGNYLLQAGKYDVLSEWYHKYHCPLHCASMIKGIGEGYYRDGKKAEAAEWYEIYDQEARLTHKTKMSFLASYYEEIGNDSRADFWNMRLGNQYHSENRPDEATKHYRKCSLRTLDPHALLMVADDYFNRFDDENAAIWYEAYAHKTNDYTGFLRVADRCWDKEQPLKAIPLYKRIYAQVQDGQIARRIADYCFANDDLEGSVEWYKLSAASQPPTDKQVLMFLAEDPSANCDPVFTTVWLKQLGGLFIAEADRTTAAQCYERCDPEKLSDAELRLVVDTCLSDGRLDDAARWYALLYERTSDLDDAKKMADRLWKLKRRDLAAVWYERYASERRNLNIAKRLGDYYFDEANKEAASQWYERANFLSKKPDETILRRLAVCSEDGDMAANWMNTLGDVLLERNDLDGAVAVYVENAPWVADPQRQKFLGGYFRDHEDWAQAEAWYQRYFEQTNDFDLAKDFANQLWETGKPDMAVKWYERYAAGRRSSNIARLIAHYYFDNHQPEEALPWYERLYALSKKAEEDVVIRLVDCCKAVQNTEATVSWLEILGDIRREARDEAGAVAAYTECGEAISDPEKQKFVADAYFADQNTALANDWYQRYFAQTKDPAVAKMMADRFWELDEPAKAIAWYECYAQEQCTPELARFIAEYYFKESNFESAASWYEVLHVLEPIRDQAVLEWLVGYYKDTANEQQVAYWSMILGNLLFDNEDMDKAALAFMDCADTVTDPQKQKIIGHSYLKNNDLVQANVWFERAFKQTNDLRLAREVGDRLWPLNPARAVAWYEVCATSACTYDLAKKLGDYYYDKRRLNVATPWYEKCHALRQTPDVEIVKRIVEYYKGLKSKQQEAKRWTLIQGDVCRAVGDAAGAAEAYTAYGTEITEPDKLRFMGEYYFSKGLVTQALEWYDRYVAKTNDYALLRDIADELWRTDRRTEAIPVYNRLVTQRQDAYVAKFLGDCFFEEENWSSAIEWYEKYDKVSGTTDENVLQRITECYKALRIQNEVSMAWLQALGDVRRGKHDIKGALEAYSECEAYICEAEKQKSIADDCFREKEWSSALSWYRKYEKSCRVFDDETVVEKITVCYKALHQENADFMAEMQRLGDIRRSKGNIRGAVEAYSECETYVKDSDKQKFIGDYYMANYVFSKATTWYARYFEQTEDQAFAKQVADRLWGPGREDMAIEWYERFHRNGVQNDENSLRRLIQYYKGKRTPHAADKWTLSLGNMFRCRNEDDKAVATYVEFGENINDPSIHKFVGDYYFDRNDDDRAHEWYFKYFESVQTLGDKAKAAQDPASVALKLGERYYKNRQKKQAAELLVIAARFNNQEKPVEITGTDCFMRGNDHILLVNDRYVFLWHDARLHFLDPSMIERYEVIQPRLFNRGSATLHLKNQVGLKVPTAYTVSENLKSDSALHTKLTELLLSNQILVV